MSREEELNGIIEMAKKDELHCGNCPYGPNGDSDYDCIADGMGNEPLGEPEDFNKYACPVVIWARKEGKMK